MGTIDLPAIEVLDDGALFKLAFALYVGGLAPPYDTSSIFRTCGEFPNVQAVATELMDLADQGWDRRKLVLLVWSIVRARSQVMGRRTIDLVWTGPEVEGASSRDTVAVVRELFQQARKTVLIAGYVIFQGWRVFEALGTRMDQDPDLDVRVFLNIERRPADTSFDPDIVDRFVERFREKEWPGRRLPALYYDPRSLALSARDRACLHAKCIVVDRSTTLVSSANFAEAALEQNIEAGVLIQSATFADHLERHFEGMVKRGAMRKVE
jgi:phosphatidylserine/phosphatidylglycerophosphate/cardiolipin synthase-like enzyme